MAKYVLTDAEGNTLPDGEYNDEDAALDRRAREMVDNPDGDQVTIETVEPMSEGLDMVKHLMQRHYSENYPLVEEPEEGVNTVAVIHGSKGMFYSGITSELIRNNLYIEATAELHDDYEITYFIGEVAEK